MKPKIILLFVMLLSGFLALNGQENDPECGFDVTKFKADRAEYFTKELKLTPEQVKTFIPMLDEFMAKKFNVNKDSRVQAHNLRGKKTITDVDYQKATEAFLDAKLKEAELQKEYYKKFATVLSAQQVYVFPRIEMNFMRKALDKNRQNHRGR